jgi:hypothetical protein
MGATSAGAAGGADSTQGVYTDGSATQNTETLVVAEVPRWTTSGPPGAVPADPVKSPVLGSGDGQARIFAADDSQQAQKLLDSLRQSGATPVHLRQNENGKDESFTIWSVNPAILEKPATSELLDSLGVRAPFDPNHSVEIVIVGESGSVVVRDGDGAMAIRRVGTSFAVIPTVSGSKIDVIPPNQGRLTPGVGRVQNIDDLQFFPNPEGSKRVPA